ncbi:uncharacterized protein LOC132718323 [Ruditapes philippinarum]|uniref:uncharacterized protein LOC132718323 n=1 Tax=Ruditapes philippinarum TaxID=129788 RepID=UPI00295AD52F|nr:uncharacterized protein LOC132718323 [Ruditapes philippinarum]
MSHQSEIEKIKYRNWVRGVLAYKYLKKGLEGFADDVVKQEHKRILSAIYQKSSTTCKLRPKHECSTHCAGKNECLLSRIKCTCLYAKKEKCRFQVCEHIMNDILGSHGSTSPTPNWENTDIQKWCTEPWEVAKCFINAPGYFYKTKADMDISGLLHVFINNASLHSHLACSMAEKNIFIKVRGRRNKLFHSASMEMEGRALTECIADIVKILEDPKELKGRPDAQQAVSKLKQLKESKFIITTNNEVDAYKEAISYVSQKSEELKQVIEVGKKEIQFAVDQDTARAKENIQTCQNDAIKEFDKRSEVIYERVEKLESDVSVLKSDVSFVKEQVKSWEEKLEELKNERHIYERRLDYVEEKKELQGKLIEYYQRHCVKTSMSPLAQEQDSINIKDIYVPSEIKVIAVNQSAQTSMPEKKYLQGYHEIFKTKEQRNKKIYVLGNVGTGKSTFCKMMIENWCKYHMVIDEARESTCPENDHEKTNTESFDPYMVYKRDDDVSQMEHFDFLFFIPLQFMLDYKSDATVDMIKELLKHLTSNAELIDRIFQEDSERCLIIADSLDEWKPHKEIVRKPHVSYGIPNGDLAKDATVITLSRPSAKGILNLKISEVDLKLELLGVSSESLKSFIERYIFKANVIEKSYYDFIEIMERKRIEHVEQTPLLLQQLLWLYTNGKDLGESVSETYCLVLNTMLGWADHKDTMIDRNESHSDATECMSFRLPEMLQKYPRFEGKERVLFLCSQTAFEALTSGSIHNIFGQRNLLKIGLSKGDITALTQVGILSKSNRFDRTEEDTQYGFIHMSYLEFFAAMFVSMFDNMKVDDKKQKILDKFLCKCKSASDVLQFSNMIKIVCGLCPALISDLSQRVSSIVNKDEDISNSRSKYYENWVFTMSMDHQLLSIQDLMLNCLKECDPDDSTMISISDLRIHRCLPLQRIKPDEVISLQCSFLGIREGDNDSDYFNDIIEFTTQLKQVQYISVCMDMYHKFVFKFSFSEKVFLRQLTLQAVKRCDRDLDLSMQNHLQTLLLNECELTVSGLNFEQLKRVEILHSRIGSDVNCPFKAGRLTDLHIINTWCSSQFIASLIQQAPLKILILSKCGELYSYNDVTDIDLSRHNHLKDLTLSNSPGLVITGLNTEQLEKVYIDYKIYHTDFYLQYEDDSEDEYDYIDYSNYNIHALKFYHLQYGCRLKKLYLENLTVDKTSTEQLLRQAPLQELTMIRVSGAQSIVEGQIRGVSNDHSVVEGNMTEEQFVDRIRAETDGPFADECHGSDNESDENGHLTDKSDDESYVEHFFKFPFLKLSDCKNFKISHLNTEKLKLVDISSSPGIFDLDNLLNAGRLTNLSLKNNPDGEEFHYNKKVDKVVHTLHQLRCLMLQNVDIDDNALTVTPDMTNLAFIKLKNTNMSLETWRTFVESLLTLHKPVEVEAVSLIDLIDSARNYVLINPKFKVKETTRWTFNFETGSRV